ncbi:hypothetical protein QJS10_CPA06g02276 [Acorus calamus]|uniref:Uncharacterized protein n=1 Tax=Acorus calamus TaxID=4465 RepID=A0AAV9ERN7_ACOCL|nr:hypothetical protein QJS10_CPA06g02276 [Acorus calamus]
MGTLVGHVVPGFGFLLLGLWHLFNHSKLHSLHPTTYTSPPWFPTKRIKYLELFFIMLASSASISMELFIGPDRHQPLDPDGTIPSNHLHNFEHSSISLTFLVYALFALAFDKLNPKAGVAMTQLAAALAFSQMLLMFHLHSADHMGVEGQYHSLLQLSILVSLVTSLMGIGYPRSFMISFIRSVSIIFHGVWMIVMGYVLWTPALVFKGCFMNHEEGHTVVRCHGHEWLGRAKSLVNIQFSWLLAGVMVFSMGLYLIINRAYTEEYQYLDRLPDNDSSDDLESPKKLRESQNFIGMGKGMRDIELQR